MFNSEFNLSNQNSHNDTKYSKEDIVYKITIINDLVNEIKKNICTDDNIRDFLSIKTAEKYKLSTFLDNLLNANVYMESYKSLFEIQNKNKQFFYKNGSNNLEYVINNLIELNALLKIIILSHDKKMIVNYVINKTQNNIHNVKTFIDKLDSKDQETDKKKALTKDNLNFFLRTLNYKQGIY